MRSEYANRLVRALRREIRTAQSAVVMKPFHIHITDTFDIQWWSTKRHQAAACRARRAGINH